MSKGVELIEALIQKHSITLTRNRIDEDGGHKWQLCRCPFDPTHRNTDAYLYSNKEYGYGFYCSHNSCSENKWKQFVEHYEPVKGEQQYSGNPNFTSFDPDDLPDPTELELPPMTFLIDRLLAKGQIGQLVGDWGSGKSYLALSWCYAIANGLPWCGFKTEQTQVLILDRENALELIQKRMKEMGIKGGRTLKIWSTKKLMENQPTSFDIELSSKTLIQYAEKYPGCLIVIDSLRAWLPAGADENKAVDIRGVMTLLRKLQALGASVLILHHNNKVGSPSGSTDIMAGVDYGFTGPKGSAGPIYPEKTRG